ncbi:MAG: ion channel [Polyangiaceae bacterium]
MAERVWRQKVRRRQGDLFELTTVGGRWAPIQDLYHRVLDMRWLWYFAIISGLFLTVNAIFALLYLAQPGCSANADGSFRDAFFFSVQTLATIGYGNLGPNTLYAHLLVTGEALTQLLGFALITGATYAKFARPRARVLWSKKAVVGMRDGVRYMMFRVANERHNQVVEAQLRVVLLRDSLSKEGESMRVPTELKLVRDRTMAFRLSWTAMHRIDESSPLYGDGVEEMLERTNAAINLSITGFDETIAQTVNARYAYYPQDIEWGRRFKDVISVEPDGSRVIDYRNFHDTIAE